MPDVCPDCKGTGWKTEQVGTHFRSIRCPCRIKGKSLPEQKRSRGRPRKHPLIIPKGREICPVCKGKKRFKSKRWGTNDPCTACNETGYIPVI